MKHPSITLAITHFNRYELLLECIHKVLTDPRLAEIVIVDDASTDGSFQLLTEFSKGYPKIRLYQNVENKDCYRNKATAVFLSESDWVILFDSDNVITPAYLDTLYALKSWDPRTLYCPDFAEPHFDYRRFAGKELSASNVAQFMGDKGFSCALNTANYFFFVDEYLRVWDDSIDPHTADTLFQSYNWLRVGNKILIVPGLRYFHRLHAGSHYKLNRRKTGSLERRLQDKIRAFAYA